jgi:hypothetical protein
LKPVPWLPDTMEFKPRQRSIATRYDLIVDRSRFSDAHEKFICT